MKPIPEYGDLIPLDEFIEMCEHGTFIDYDGFGNYATETEMSTNVVCPSDITAGIINRNWTHVVWFNR
jgi:hypothetical protein